MSGPEYVQVEAPLLRQLMLMGWEHLPGQAEGAFKPEDPTESGRDSFAEVLMESRLRKALLDINPGPNGDPWLDDARISQVMGELTRITAKGLLEANELTTELLIKGVTVPGLPGWDGGRDQRVHFIDWKHWQRNEFVVVSQFRVDVPGMSGLKHIAPDEVLLVNGIPLVVVECKKPSKGDAIAAAVTQLRRYAGQGRGRIPTGNPKLFHTVQLTVATCGERARLGTFTSDTEHYVPWRDPYPLIDETIAAALECDERSVTEQNRLTAVVLHPERMLRIIHDYVTFMTLDNGIRIKAAPRYQQYRAVEKTLERLLTGDTREEDGAQDRRGGIIWHTQGSGKSLTMTFLVRRMRSIPELSAVKVVLVTDRTQLQKQLSETLRLTGEEVEEAKRVKQAKRLLAAHGPGIVAVMIQKQQDVTARSTDGELGEAVPSLGELNDGTAIVVLIDEAHRSHGSTLHMNLLEALPNCARIGFTGTPIIMGKQKRTSQIFGSIIDTYRLADAEADGAVVRIFYEGNTVKGAVRDGRDLDEVFEDLFADQSEEDREALQRRYATKGDVIESEELIAAKARHLLRHYVTTVIPGGFKAQLVANSREATLRYREALLAAREELVRQAEEVPARLLDTPQDQLTARQIAQVNAHRNLDLLNAMDFVPVISPGTDDDEERFIEWTAQKPQERRVDDFTKPFPAEIGPEDHPVAFLIVKSMLLTGFDAPIEQVLYIDRSLKQAELLQAVARVNRPTKDKKCGYIVDYFGVANHLTEALKAYAADDVDGVLVDLHEEVAKLGPMRRRLQAIFSDHGVTPSGATLEDCVLLLNDGARFDRFEAELKRFLITIDVILPEPTVRPFLKDATLYAEIAMRAKRRFRVDGGDFDPSVYGAKVRQLLDDHLLSLGIDQKLPPVSLTADDFEEKVAALPGARTRASEMEHAVRDHIEINRGKDPRFYKQLSQRLEEILRDYAENWEQQATLLADLVAELRDDRPAPDDPLSPVERALYGVLLEETARDGVVDPETDQWLCDISTGVCRIAQQVTHRRDFWRSPVDQEDFRHQTVQWLINGDVVAIDKVDSLADQLLEVIGHRRTEIPRP
ncbi:HsdR family type I site-specific deoxyribonuclease [Streptomyces sp. N2-109]|uniref:Type I restriction enzyme endonuclease subunit n=1 Tax=Streptomyces gossypii TaxID=2883101 RepID=A0ABT2JPA7_9ACTN|nr:HsdR family type I site-specific deoxyribonuclease [Streptomyces gossypii]MCT2589701.1 HsdR family type I site-specific deoxyribonuclease [Streptomyces gossypii]